MIVVRTERRDRTRFTDFVHEPVDRVGSGDHVRIDEQ